MTEIKLYAEWGAAPVGSEVIEHDWIEDEHGYRERFEYEIIPEKVVTVYSPWSPISPRSFLELCEMFAPADVVRFTVSAPDSRSFHASTWVRVPEAVKAVTEFVKENS